jgi:hypothetical protein
MARNIDLQMIKMVKKIYLLLFLVLILSGCGGMRYHYSFSIYNDCGEDVQLYFGERPVEVMKHGEAFGENIIISQGPRLNDEEYDSLVNEFLQSSYADTSPITAKTKMKNYTFTSRDMVTNGDISRHGMIYYICSQSKKPDK